MSIFATSDIHGCRKTFNKLLDIIGLSVNDELIIIGDVIDRGPDSSGLITDLLKLKEDGFKITLLRGNHEDFMLKSINNKNIFRNWTYPPNGGDKTLDQYGFKAWTKTTCGGWQENFDFVDSIPTEHWHLISQTKLIHEIDGFVFVHAGLNFVANDPIKGSNEEDLLWSRNFTYDSVKLNNRILITGHTPTPFPEINVSTDIVKEFKTGHIIIDAGCPFKSRGYGNLCCLKLDDLELFFVENCE
jgi:serine/threonine protein phosphatase 1